MSFVTISLHEPSCNSTAHTRYNKTAAEWSMHTRRCIALPNVLEDELC